MIKVALQLFRSQIVYHADERCNASGVVSRKCYLDWLTLKQVDESDQQARKFFRALLNHVTGVDGRTPFEPSEEAAILEVLRKRIPWPCFPTHLSHLGRGFRSSGYHEKRQTQLVQHHQRSTASPPTTTLPAFEITTETFEQITRMLPCDEVDYLKNLGTNIVRNYYSPDFSMDQWKCIIQIMRFMILAKTKKCTVTYQPHGILAYAQSLCRRFTLDDKTLVKVMDLSAANYVDRMLVQNEYCKEIMGPLVGNPNGRAVHGRELFGVVTAAGAAYHRPGLRFWVMRQRNYCRNGEIRLLDICYYCDPESLLLVWYGRLSPVNEEGGMNLLL